MFQKSWFPPAYYHPSYFPELGGIPPQPIPTRVPGSLLVYDMETSSTLSNQFFAFPDYVFVLTPLSVVQETFSAKGASLNNTLNVQGAGGVSTSSNEEQSLVDNQVNDMDTVITNQPEERKSSSGTSKDNNISVTGKVGLK